MLGAGLALLASRPLQADPQPPSAPAAATPPIANGGPGREQVYQLNPFEVKTDQDTGYGALQSNSLSAFSMDLQKMPATAEVFTQQFIKDTHSSTIESMLISYSGIVGYTPGDSAAYTESSGDRDGGGGLSVRGFGNAAGIKFDGFFGPPSAIRSASGSTPTYLVDRVEVIEGPQSLLYGSIGAGGVINAVYKQAQFNAAKGSAEYRFDDLGSKVADIDYNYGTSKVAVRFAAWNQTAATTRVNLGQEQKGFYTQLAFKVLPTTTIRLIDNKYETVAHNGFDPSIKPFLPSNSTVLNNSTKWLAANNQIPAGVFGGAVNWSNVDSFSGWWSDEPSMIHNSSLEIESNPLPWLSGKLVAIYNEYKDWRNTSSLSLVAAGANSNPFSASAITVAPKLNFQSQRQKGVQLSLLATNDLFNGGAHSQTAVGGYLNHLGPSFGSSGIDYQYALADSNWNPVIGSNTATDYGRTFMPTLAIPIVNGQIMRYGLFQPGRTRVTVNGLNYVLVPRIYQTAAAKGSPIAGVPTNPYGLVPNAANSGFSGNFNPGNETHEVSMYLANYTDWLGGKFTTLAGVNVDKAINYNFGATNASFIPWTRVNGWEVGAIYQILPWLGVYVTDGTAASAAASTHDLYGNSLSPPTAKGHPEFGLKAHSLDQKYTAQLSWDYSTSDKNELQSTDSSYQNAVNPSGLNGRFGGNATNNFVNIDRTATSLEFTATANPTPEWRMRFNADYLFARVLNNVSYRQLYNDQFHVNSAGQVTYANGNVVFVNGNAATQSAGSIVAAGTAGATPLTLALMNTSTSAYYASPDPVAGNITNSTLKTILTTGGGSGSVGAAQVAANGAANTGVTGLPLSSIQYNFSSPFPNNVVPVYFANNVTTGYPGWQWNAETDYTFGRGPLKGLGAYFDAAVQYSTRAYYTFYPNTTNAGLGSAASNQVNESRILTVLPTITVCNVGVHYQYKFKRCTFYTEVTVNNVFNSDRFYNLPQATNGTFLQNTQRNAPRLWSWSNELDF